MRVPIFREKHIPFFWMIFQNMTFGTIFQIGDAWVGRNSLNYITKNNLWKRSYGFQVRLNGFSFYNYPVAIEYEIHQPIDEVVNKYVNNNEEEVIYEKKSRSYIKILFDF